MKLALLVMVVGCAGEGERQNARWPDHRKHEEQRIADLEKEVANLTERIAELERRGTAAEKVTEPVIDQQMIASALQQVKAQLVACGDKAPTAKGTVKIHAKV